MHGSMNVKFGYLEVYLFFD